MEMMSIKVSEQNSTPWVESERLKAELESRVESMGDEIRHLRAENERLGRKADTPSRRRSVANGGWCHRTR